MDILSRGYYIAEDAHEQQIMKPYHRWGCSISPPI